MTVDGSDADGNDRLPLGVGELFVVERDDNNSHILVRQNENISFFVSRTLRAISLVIVETRYFQQTQLDETAGTLHKVLTCRLPAQPRQ